MIGSFRFMEPRFCKELLDGRIRFGSLEYYRCQEWAERNQVVGDGNEGRARNIVDHRFGDLPPSEQDLMRLREVGCKIGTSLLNSSIRIDHTQIVNGYVLCFSHGILRRLCERRAAHGSPVTAYVQINDLKTFRQTIFNTARFVDADDLTGKLMRDVADLSDCRPVGYESADPSLLRPAVLKPDPFVKRPHYWYQREYRLLLVPRNPQVQRDFLSLGFDVPDGLFKMVCIENTEGKAPAAQSICPTFEDRFHELKSVLEQVDLACQGSRLPPSEYDADLDARLRSAYWLVRKGGPACPSLDARMEFFSQQGDVCHLAYFVRQYADIIDHSDGTLKEVFLRQQ